MPLASSLLNIQNKHQLEFLLTANPESSLPNLKALPTLKSKKLRPLHARCCHAGGDAHLGGDDWDAVIVQWLQEQYLQPAGVVTGSPSMSARLKALAEFAKVSLSDNEQVVLR